ncbi:type I restriction endonuclease subunit R [Gloeobacter kilaueensis]|uniref:Type I restriction enzyme endonuclease subunit n=1 Tax=Gloeobacter kilaueensis (strain ATCC BAA-2537 / CCAP 1431/1 / ULC 316 / JS1) TaxID=1183438 RepID=U5QIU6_GLOK1|nr:HsdR family type I site-specific deoxyribonuclease [Gloeobacter kilaueensis]AGY57549.1 type I site-specific deoxyribonuclease, HsdR family [Gloeobacter kilaueensis JS1]
MSERSAVQNPMLLYASGIGWEYVAPERALALRGGSAGLYFNNILEEQLLRLNPNVVDAARAADILRQLTLLRPTIEGNRDALTWLRGEQSVFVPGERRERNVRLIDFDGLENNVFQVTEEWRQQGVAFNNRADVVFLINGIPVAVAETKASSKPNAVAEGIDQIRRYHNETPEMFTAAQVFEVTQLWDFYYGVTWNTVRKNLFNWKEEIQGDYERKVKAFFSRSRFLKLLHDHILFLTSDDQLLKIILRQHQVKAVERVIERVQDPVKRRGLIWHTQGSGKTLTMITIAAQLLRDVPGTEKATVLMLVDRNELETQLFKNISAYGIGAVKVAQNKNDLKQILASDHRGLVVSMIHKFDDIPAAINPRTGVVVLVDEAHRTTGGDLGNYLMAALPNATYIGFTGTPIDRLASGKGTFKVFGCDDEQGYLDKYSIRESIEDGTTLKLNYTLAPSELRVERETLEQQFLNLADTEGVSDIEELNAVLDRAVVLKEMMKAPSRIEQIAAHVAQHFRENVERMGFKAFLVAVDREACVLYKEALDKHLPPEWSVAVYSSLHNDPPKLRQYALSPEAEKQVRRDFIKKDSLPKILIVTEKLLTGYDAPILYCLYLDKPMRDHVLLQTIARVNRPYEDENNQPKSYGFVLDFVGIFERLERALAFDPETVATAIQNIDVLKHLFTTLMSEAAPKYLSLTRGWNDKARERAIEHFLEVRVREEFFKFFKQVQSLYDILSPDAFLRPFIDDYQALAELYAEIRNAYSTDPYIDKELTRKTMDLLRQGTAVSNLATPATIYELGPAELAAIKDGNASDTAKVLNLRKLLAAKVAAESQAKPFLLSIGERAEEVVLKFEDRQLTTQQALEEFERLAREYIEADAERRRLAVDENTYAIYTALNLVVPDLTVAQAERINELFKAYPDYLWNESEKAKLRAELYKNLRTLAGPSKMIHLANTLLKLQRV